MSIHERISAGREASEDAMRRHLIAAVDIAERHPGGRTAIGEALCAALDTVGGGAPRYEPFGNMRDDASWWADMATPIELEIYVAAALRRIPRASFAERARKRMFWALWGSMPKTDQEAFLARVEREKTPP